MIVDLATRSEHQHGETPPLMRIEGLTVEFPNRSREPGAPRRFRAVDGLSLEIRPGEVLGLVGESGSGKTTVGKALLRLYEPAGGRVWFRDTDITHLSERRLKPYRRNLQMIFQDPLASLNPRHTVGRALEIPLLLHRICKRSEVRGAVDRILSEVGLSPTLRDRFPHELSGGQLQRVAIGRALTLSPALIVADEAVSKLDVSVRAQILNLFKEVQERLGLSLLFITHDLHVARYLCHRIGVMYFGKLVELAPTETLFTSPRHPYTQALLGTLDKDLELAERDEGFVIGEDLGAANEGCRYYNRCEIRTARCRIAHPPLERVEREHDIACYERGSSFPAERQAKS
ncbi:MAG TPA: ABC transporter ATP-binding protein [Alphaproteobacteria bacterium]|nr:ABC transporter ATP-binding protein [Alphaproteobacteria bacterium]